MLVNEASEANQRIEESIASNLALALIRQDDFLTDQMNLLECAYALSVESYNHGGVEDHALAIRQIGNAVGKKSRMRMEQLDLRLRSIWWPFGGVTVGKKPRMRLEQFDLRKCSYGWALGSVEVGKNERL